MTTQTQPPQAGVPQHATNLTYQPHVDVQDFGTEIVLVADVPGARAESLDISFEDGVLTVQAAVEPRVLPGRCVRQEYGVGDYRRSFRLGEGFDASLITADYRRGVLTIRVPRLAAVRPRKIAVQTA